MFILNGRCDKDKNIGKFTFRDTSVIDYVICSPNCLGKVKSFEITDLDTLFSDGHSLLSIVVSLPKPIPKITHARSNCPHKRWDESKKDIFIQNINRQEVNDLTSSIQTIQNKNENISINDIDSILNRIAGCFKAAADSTFSTQQKVLFKRKDNDQIWFGNDCNQARNEYNKAKQRNNKFPTSSNKKFLTEKSKKYKYTMNKHINKYKAKTKNKLRSMQSKRPKEFWKIINSMEPKSQEKNVNIDDFYDFFKGEDNLIDYEPDFGNEININDDDEILNVKITSQEILRCVKHLKNNKACGTDYILNEYIKASIDIMMPVYVNLFNLILDSGAFPSSWLEGIIRPIYKKKGDTSNPENYRPITILSCFGKLFTSVLNLRLNDFVEHNDSLEENQAGFRKGYATSDHIFTLHAMVEILKSRKKKLFCTFVDFKKAFDNVWRPGLWHKLLHTGVDGKILRIIRSMYQGIKSKISICGQETIFFSIVTGLRQGENLSPVLFSLFINDLEDYLTQHGCEGIRLEYDDEELTVLAKLLILLYADDTVIMADDEQKLQFNLDCFLEFCNTWKLNVNYTKTKVLIFGARNTSKFKFTLDGKHIEIVDIFKYLGVYFSSSRSFLKARKHVTEQARKALILLYKRIRHFNLPIDLQIKLFDHTIVPILLYGSEVWGMENIDLIEKFHNSFLRKITNLKKSTPIYMLHAELGRYPLQINIKMRMINLWLSIITGKFNKLSNITYKILKSEFDSGVYEHKWPKSIKNILDSVGMSELWQAGQIQNVNATRNYIRQTLIDQNLQTWQANLEMSTKGLNYKLYKSDINIENYLTLFPRKVYYPIIRFRTTNHKLPVELGRWENVPFDERKCIKCNSSSLGDEFHYLLECNYFARERHMFLKKYFYKHPNIIKYKKLMTSTDIVTIKNLSKMLDVILKVFEKDYRDR